jgi:hypothetical protein
MVLVPSPAPLGDVRCDMSFLGQTAWSLGADETLGCPVCTAKNQATGKFVPLSEIPRPLTDLVSPLKHVLERYRLTFYLPIPYNIE